MIDLSSIHKRRNTKRFIEPLRKNERVGWFFGVKGAKVVYLLKKKKQVVPHADRSYVMPVAP